MSGQAKVRSNLASRRFFFSLFKARVRLLKLYEGKAKRQQEVERTSEREREKKPTFPSFLSFADFAAVLLQTTLG